MPHDISINNARLKCQDICPLGMRWLLVIILATGLLGCKKQSDQTGNSTPQDSPEIAAALTELTQDLRKYVMEHRATPKDFAELVAVGYVKNPPPAPAGKRFEIDPKNARVILVNQ